jgi:hypothetical protein
VEKDEAEGFTCVCKHAAARGLADTRTLWWNCGTENWKNARPRSREDGNRIITIQKTKCRTNKEARNRGVMHGKSGGKLERMVFIRSAIRFRNQLAVVVPSKHIHVRMYLARKLTAAQHCDSARAVLPFTKGHLLHQRAHSILFFLMLLLTRRSLSSVFAHPPPPPTFIAPPFRPRSLATRG